MWTFGSPRWSLDLAEDRLILLHCSLALIELSGISRDVSELQLIQFSLFALIIFEFTSVNKLLVFWLTCLHSGIFQSFQHPNWHFFRQFFIVAQLRSFSMKTWRYTNLCTCFVGIFIWTYD
jgi:hypothetical protein